MSSQHNDNERSEIPCSLNPELKKRIQEYAEKLKTEAHTIGGHGLTKDEFYNSGVFRGAIERVRGQFAATMVDKREFAACILDDLLKRDFIQSWESAGESNRHDYQVTLNNGRIAAIELKGCLDGNNTNIFERPPQANEFIIWSICTNPGANLRKNVWSGIHTRLSAEIISNQKQVDGLVVWDMACGTIGRPCPKILGNEERITEIGAFKLPPPCIYLFPSTVPSPRNNPNPKAQKINEVKLLDAFHRAYKSEENELNYVDFEVFAKDNEIYRVTKLVRNGALQRESSPTNIKRT